MSKICQSVSAVPLSTTSCNASMSHFGLVPDSVRPLYEINVVDEGVDGTVFDRLAILDV